MTKLINEDWTSEKIPDIFKKGIITKIPKKGDLSNPNNWRGITLLSMPGKVLSGVIADRIRPHLEKTLREEQAGFRPGRGCTDQIFTLRRVIEKCLEKNKSILINFIDFEKAFDSIHQESLWKILKYYGIPPRIVSLLDDLYNDTQACVKIDDQETLWFNICTGVKQGCVLSPLLFVIAIDWIMRTSLENEKLGL
jgi:hypothetical protein